MAPPNLITQTAAGAPLSLVTFVDVNPGTPTSATAFRLKNDDTGGPVDDALEPRLTVFLIDAATGEQVVKGQRPVDERWVEIRALGTGSTGADQPATGWIPIGSGRLLELEKILEGEYVDLEIRLSVPGTGPVGDYDFVLVGDDDGRRVALEQGNSEPGRDGVLNGIGDGTVSEWLAAATPTDGGSTDDTITIPDLEWVHVGVPWVRLTTTLVLNDQDSASATLAVGESYWAVLSLGASTTITVTKSLKGSSPLPDSSIPVAPAGELILANVERQQAGISNSDIDFLAELGRFGVTASGLALTIGPGRALVDNSLMSLGAETILSLADTSTVDVWLVADADSPFQTTTDGSRPELRAYRLYRVTTSGGSINLSTLIDYRDTIGAERIVAVATFEGTLSAGLDRHLRYWGARPGYVRLDRGIVFGIDDAGSGNTTGIYRVDVTVGGVDLFTSKATDDRRPTIEHDDAAPQLDTSALPEVLTVDPFDSIVVTLDLDEAYDGTGPSDATVTLIVEMP